MATSSCPKCGQHRFEIKENGPSGGAYKLMFVQCASCGTVVGVQDFYNVGAMLLQQNKAIKQIASQVGTSVTLD